MKSLRQWNRERKHRRRIRRCRQDVVSRQVVGVPHSLSTRLIVSLTSFPPRYGHLALTLQGLLKQSVLADEIILWIAEDDVSQLPTEVLDLRAQGLEVKTCPDLRSYKKLLPLLEVSPDATIVTADDDVYYGADWLETILRVHQATGDKVVCGRGHRMVLGADGLPLAYADWDHNAPGQAPSGLIFPTGVGGILYAPGAFHPSVSDWDLAESLCPTADDVWFYWMHRLIGGRAVMTGERRRVLEWEQDPTGGLLAVNRAGGNDRQIAAMIEKFGFPEP